MKRFSCKAISVFFFLLLSLNALAAVCDNFERVYAQGVTGVTLPDQAKVWDRNGNNVATVKQTADSNFSCIGKWEQDILIPVYEGEGLKYRGNGNDVLTIEYLGESKELLRTIELSDPRFNGLRLALLDVNIEESSNVFPENGFIRFKSGYDACERNELFLSVCNCTNDCISGEKECVDRQSSPNSFRSCGNFDADACLEWGAVQQCPASSPSCDANGNCGAKCKNECTTTGKKTCFNVIDKPNLYQECGNYDEDECLEWGDAKECPLAAQSCDINGNCVSNCLNDCAAAGAKQCVNVAVTPNLYKACGNYDADNCLEWGNPIECTAAKPYCDANGNCSCIDVCSKKGIVECVNTDSVLHTYRACGNFDTDPCLEWDTIKTCPFDTPFCDANAGKCFAVCENECEIGKGMCADANTFIACGNFDKDSCYEYGKEEACPTEKPLCNAENGACVPECENECPKEGGAYCVDGKAVPGTFKECGNFDRDACLEYGETKTCPENRAVCTNGKCSAECLDECIKGKKQCGNVFSYPNTFKECGNFDNDACLEWGVPQKCPDERQACSISGECIVWEGQPAGKNESNFLQTIISQISEFIAKILGKK